MLAVFINCATVIVGSLIGLLVGKHLKESFKEIVFACSGLITLVMGIQMAMQSSNFLVLLLALLIGGALGYLLKIEDRVLSLGDKLGKMTGNKDAQTGTQNFAKGFLTASVLFCSGAMSVVGSIQAGTTGEMTTILIKSVMDGCMAVVFASVYGIGVMFSFLFILLYQGFFTLAGGWLEPLLGAVGINELSAEGGVLLLMIGFGLLKIREFKTANFLPALVFAPVFGILADRIL